MKEREGPVGGGGAEAGGAGPGSAVVGPGFEGGDLGGREAFADRGHGFSTVPFDAGDEFAGGGGAGLDDLEEGFAGVQAEAGHLGFGAMAAQAAGGEDGGDLGGEVGREQGSAMEDKKPPHTPNIIRDRCVKSAFPRVLRRSTGRG